MVVPYSRFGIADKRLYELYVRASVGACCDCGKRCAAGDGGVAGRSGVPAFRGSVSPAGLGPGGTNGGARGSGGVNGAPGGSDRDCGGRAGLPGADQGRGGCTDDGGQGLGLIGVAGNREVPGVDVVASGAATGDFSPAVSVSGGPVAGGQAGGGHRVEGAGIGGNSSSDSRWFPVQAGAKGPNYERNLRNRQRRKAIKEYTRSTGRAFLPDRCTACAAERSRCDFCESRVLRQQNEDRFRAEKAAADLAELQEARRNGSYKWRENRGDSMSRVDRFASQRVMTVCSDTPSRPASALTGSSGHVSPGSSVSRNGSPQASVVESLTREQKIEAARSLSSADKTRLLTPAERSAVVALRGPTVDDLRSVPGSVMVDLLSSSCQGHILATALSNVRQRAVARGERVNY